MLTSCEKENVNNEKNIRIDIGLITELNSKSYDTLIIESRKFVLDAYLWRDFMPISPANGKPLNSINRLRHLDSTEIPNNIDLVKQYIINNDSIWISDYENEFHPTPPDYMIEKISIKGPKWGPKIYVDVISKVHDSLSNTDYYIRIKDVYIERTD
jgi:hypothetical protein